MKYQITFTVLAGLAKPHAHPDPCLAGVDENMTNLEGLVLNGRLRSVLSLLIVADSLLVEQAAEVGQKEDPLFDLHLVGQRGKVHVGDALNMPDILHDKLPDNKEERSRWSDNTLDDRWQ